jgi:rifampicin phosphotransferase
MSDFEAKEYWIRDTIHWPRPVHPLFVSYGLTPVEIGSKQAYEEWSIPSQKNAYLVLHGYVYQRTEPIGGDSPKIMEKYPFLFNLWRVSPKLRNRILGFERFLKDKGFENNVTSWKEIWEPEARLRLEPIKNFKPEKASLSDLAEHLEQCYEFLCWSWNPHIKVVMVCMYIRERWLDLCEKRLNLTEFEAFELIQTGDPQVFRTTHRLIALAHRAASDPLIRDILSLPNEEALLKLNNTGFKGELDQFIEDEGDRPIDSFELDPTWREMPEVVVGIIKGFMDSDYDPSKDEEDFQTYRLQRIQKLRSDLNGEFREEFDYWLKLAEQSQPLIDIHDYLLSNIPLCHVRYDAIEAGKRFAEEGIINEPEDILFLYREELRSALQGKSDRSNLSDLISERKAKRAQAFSLVPPQTLGKMPAEPPWEVFPPVVAEGMKLFLKAASGIEAQQGANPGFSGEGELIGTPGSSGVAEGLVRIIHSAEEFHLVQAGEILVCPFTTPTWTVLFPHVAALVTDSGGALSHAAIVAREYRLPSVVGTLCGTTLLKNGQRIRVDGTTGKIQILDKD